jgi:hypothetical protein
LFLGYGRRLNFTDKYKVSHLVAHLQLVPYDIKIGRGLLVVSKKHNQVLHPSSIQIFDGNRQISHQHQSCCDICHSTKL